MRLPNRKSDGLNCYSEFPLDIGSGFMPKSMDVDLFFYDGKYYIIQDKNIPLDELCVEGIWRLCGRPQKNFTGRVIYAKLPTL